MDRKSPIFEKLEHRFGVQGEVYFPVPIPASVPGEDYGNPGTTAAIDTAEILEVVYRSAFADDRDYLRHGLEELQEYLKELRAGRANERSLFDSEGATGGLEINADLVHIKRLGKREAAMSTELLAAMTDEWLTMLPPAQQALGEMGVEQAVDIVKRSKE